MNQSQHHCCGLTALGALVFGLNLISILPCPAAESDLPDLKEVRRQAARRDRRIIYNSDGAPQCPYRTPEQFLYRRLTHLANTQTDTVFQCTGNTTTFRGHVPKVGEMHGQFVPLANDWDMLQYESLVALREAGHDQLSLASRFCREHDLEIFFSLRMNDLHDTFRPSLRSRWKRDHLEYCLGKEEDAAKYPGHDPRHWWTALNYELPEVRDYIFRIAQDVCQRYDVDGIELDWFRMPILFRPNLELRPVASEQVAMMNEFMRRVRTMTEQVGRKRGRPLLISTRIPLSVRRSLAMGLDVETWLEEDLVDMLVLGGGYAPMAMSPQVREAVQLSHRHGVQVYPCISKGGMQGEFDCVEAWRGAAMNIWQAGADGIYTFNLFPEGPDERFRQMGSPETLQGLDKIYAVDNFVADTYYLGCYHAGLFAPGRLPVTLKAGQPATVRLPVGEDIAANAPAGKTARARLRLGLSGPLAGDELSVTVNGKPLGAATSVDPPKSESYLEFEADPRLFKAGDNEVELQQTTGDQLTLDRLDLVVSYAP